jgi:ABC-type hemin transport system ATPase subunit
VAADGPPREVLEPERIRAYYGAVIDVVPVGGVPAVVPRRVSTVDTSGV